MTGKRGGIWLAAVGMCLMLAGCSQEKTTARTGFYLDTVVELTIYGGEPETADKAMELIAHYDRLFSPEGEESDIVRMNQASGQPVTVDADTASLLQLACRCAERTGGAFDPTIGPAAALWDFQREPPVVPEEEALSRAAALTDWRSVSVDGCRVTLTGEGRAVNLGGVAKGYIADRVRDYLAEQGVERALINLGGNVYAMGDKNGGDWTIGIRDPLAALAGEEPRLAAAVKVRGQAVVTSGVYERCFLQGETLYHHLLDPATGWPVHNGLASVTIVCADSAWADALSTACFVMGEEAGLALAEALDGVEALFIREDGSLTATTGLRYTDAV